MLELLEQPTTYIPPLFSFADEDSAPQVRYIRLTSTKGIFFALIDDDNYDRVSEHTWNAHLNKKGKGNYYAETTIKGRTVSLARVILGLVHGDGLIADHIDTEDTLNNCRSNLRIATHAESAMNRNRFKNNKCGLKGVRLLKGGKYGAEIRCKGVYYWLGSFDTKEEAHAAYCAKARSLHGRFACTN